MGAAKTTDATAEFFAELGRRGHEPLLRKATGTVRFELVDGAKIDRWNLVIKKGAIAVSRRGATADAVLRAERAVFGRLAAGELNAVTAMLRGELAASGNRRLLVLVQRLLPGPASARRAGRRAGYARRRT